MTNQQFLFTSGLYPLDKRIGFTEPKDSYIPSNYQRDVRIDSALYILTGYTIEQIRVKSRIRKLTEPRQIGMFFYVLSGKKLSHTAFIFHRDHATVIHAKRLMLNLYRQNGQERLTYRVERMSELTGIKIN
jgi:hypothetical protein